jgi:hypothetical protein
MDLERSLRSIQSVADLPKLVNELGHQPNWEAVPDEAWNRPGSHPLHVVAVGQTGELPWLALQSNAPQRDATTLARRLTRRGRVGMTLALDPVARRLAVAVGFAHCPGIELNLSSPAPEVVTALRRLAGGSEGGPLGFAARAAEAIATEPVGHRFFREFRNTLDRMAAGLPPPIPGEDRHGFVLLHLTRLLFLYFIQAKGWLGGRDRFLAEEVDRCLSRGRRIHRDLLRPLFFGTLNQPLSTRTRSARRFGAIPFLNGGLFEPHPLERQYRVNISNTLWRDAFDGLFERFHFTVSEDGQSGAVAPDMLGRVFEGVMEPEARHASGTFYTPVSLVEQVLETALLALVATRLACTEQEAERRLGDREPVACQLIASITLLDPAVGSGAFLLRALDRLSSCIPGSDDVSARKRWVLQHNLFGVDRNAAAVRLAELRLWLAVIADDPTDRPERVAPLPNLDCLIRQGDSLVEPSGLELASVQAAPNPELAVQLSELRQEVVTASGPQKRTLVRRLRALELQAVNQSLEASEQAHRAAIAECLRSARAGDLFGRRRGLDGELRGQLNQLRRALGGLRQIRRRLQREGEVPWFHYQSHFADVFARGGFDIVIGNPPWLRSEAIPHQFRRRLTGRYRWWKTRSRSYGNSPDLAVAFLERALELCAPQGIVAMLLPSKLATASYATTARHALASSTTLHAIADLTGTAQAAFDATVYPLALIVGKSPPASHHRVRTELPVRSRSCILQSELSGGSPWILVQSGLRRLIAGMERDHPALGDTILCHLGVKTGLNHAFLNPPSDVEPELLRWALRGRDLSPFRYHRRVRLLWTHDARGQPRGELPQRARLHLERFDAALRARRDYQGGPPWMVFRARPAVARYRVLWSDLARRMTCAALVPTRDLDCIPLNSCYVASVGSALRAETLASWLNSTWMRAIARLGAVPAAGGFARFNAQVVSRLPLPSSVFSDPNLARLARAGRAGAMVQEELDRRVARHLGLSQSAQDALRTAVGSSSLSHHCR